jgi:hypothetical protein
MPTSQTKNKKITTHQPKTGAAMERIAGDRILVTYGAPEPKLISRRISLSKSPNSYSYGSILRNNQYKL